MDLLAANHLGRAMHTTVYDTSPDAVPNFARFTFLHLDAARDFSPDCNTAADTCVAILHTEAGRDPHDKDLHDLVGELSTRSDAFRRRWSAHNVRAYGAGTNAPTTTAMSATSNPRPGRRGPGREPVLQPYWRLTGAVEVRHGLVEIYACRGTLNGLGLAVRTFGT
jgi:hypothetical protein